MSTPAQPSARDLSLQVGLSIVFRALNISMGMEGLAEYIGSMNIRILPLEPAVRLLEPQLAWLILNITLMIAARQISAGSRYTNCPKFMRFF